MRITVDTSRCQGHARCAALAPTVYELDDLGYVVPPPDALPPELEQPARTGAAACPERALTVVAG
jgi:ferredoxin